MPISNLQYAFISKEYKLKSELVQFEREEAEKRLKPIRQSEENLSVIEAKPPSPAEKVKKKQILVW